MRIFIFFIVFLALAPAVSGQTDRDTTSTVLHWHARTQVAGFQGLISVGGGPVLAKGVWRPALMYGFAPAARGREAVHQIILHNAIVFMPHAKAREFWVSPAISAAILLETGRHSYLRLPDKFPDGYYSAPQPHGTLGIGARLNRRMPEACFLREITFGAEFVGLDTYMWYAISERDIPIHRAFGLSFALAAAF